MSSFPDVRLISNGQNVDEVDTNQPIFDLIERTNWLKNNIDSLLVQSSRLFITDAACSDDCQDSNCVYYDKDTEKWDIASATIIELGDGTDERPAPESYAQGIIKDITGPAGSRKGIIYLYGAITDINKVNFLEENEIIIGEPVFLTGRDTHKGQATYTPPSVEVFLGKFMPSGEFLFTPYFRNMGEQHRHIWFKLEYDNFTQVGDPLDGHWLYHYSHFPVWPPISFTSAVLSINGVAYFHNSYFYLSADGVHYIHPDYPPIDDPEQFEAVLYYQVPYGQERREELLTGGVDSLYARTLNLKIYEQGTTNPASTGDLEILNIPLISEKSTTTLGTNVIKSLSVDNVTGEIGVFKGPVVERLYPGSDNVIFKVHNNPALAEYGLMDLFVINEFVFDVGEDEAGWLAWKDITIDPVTGEHTVLRGPVLERIYAKYTDPGVKNIFFTPHTDPDVHAFDYTARLDLAIQQKSTVESDVEAGNLVVKDIDISTEGNIELLRGPVVEDIHPRQTHVAIYEEGTSTPATQGSLDISVMQLHKIRFLHTGNIAAGATIDPVYLDNGYQARELLYHESTVVQSMISISSNVTNGQLDAEIYADPLSGPSRHLSDLDVSLDFVTNNIWNKSSQYNVRKTELILVPSERLRVKFIASAAPGFVGYVDPGDINDLYSIEVVLFVIIHD